MPTYRKKMSIRRRKPKSKSGVVSDSVKKYVKSVTKKSLPEMKYASVVVTPAEFSMVLSDALLPGFIWSEFAEIPQGVGVNQRVGNQINLQGFHSKITYFNNTNVPLFVRRLIVSYTVDDANATTSGAELFNTSGTGNSLAGIGNHLGVIQTPINLVEYKVYYDKTFKLGPSSSSDGSNTRLVNYFEKFGGKRITYENQNVGIYRQNFRFAEIIIAVTANQDITAGATLEISRHTRTYFTDP